MDPNGFVAADINPDKENHRDRGYRSGQVQYSGRPMLGH